MGVKYKRINPHCSMDTPIWVPRGGSNHWQWRCLYMIETFRRWTKISDKTKHNPNHIALWRVCIHTDDDILNNSLHTKKWPLLNIDLACWLSYRDSIFHSMKNYLRIEYSPSRTHAPPQTLSILLTHPNAEETELRQILKQLKSFHLIVLFLFCLIESENKINPSAVFLLGEIIYDWYIVIVLHHT